ncbi:hypothetical protein [Hymenobacter lapidiphilus]|uniref:Uncharacterized protein n=1 Tax=Hymenobacter lapidiphilus TaxID=2608003 RepID=A0A7Y7PM29_9BACT|nr:hypothetical protein [Hymenobacter lapidiphilus]NVO30324.1 hypothetical protein [Hymenobacter lapidiphilus]
MLQPGRKAAALSVAFSVLGGLLSACSKSEEVAPASPPATYALTDMRYFMAADDRIDSTTVLLKTISVQNPTDVLLTQQVEVDYELKKTSQFTIAQANPLPAQVKLGDFKVGVPTNLVGNTLLISPRYQFLLNATPQSKPYDLGYKQVMTIRVPPRSRIEVTSQVTALQLHCSFRGLVNEETAQRYPAKQYPVEGKWQGLLYYHHFSVTFTEHPL